MTAQSPNTQQPKAYHPPVLVVYGSIINLTKSANAGHPTSDNGAEPRDKT